MRWRWILSFIFIVVSCAVASAQADTVTLLFTDPNTPAATSYTLEQSTNGGLTWMVVPALQITTTCSGIAPATACTSVVTGVAATGYILFRFTSNTASGPAVRFNGGGWYCGSCAPLVATKTGVQ